MLFQPLSLAKARAGGREAQRLQGQKSWGPWKPLQEARVAHCDYTHASHLLWIVHGTVSSLRLMQPFILELGPEGHGEGVQ